MRLAQTRFDVGLEPQIWGALGENLWSLFPIWPSGCCQRSGSNRRRGCGRGGFWRCRNLFCSLFLLPPAAAAAVAACLALLAHHHHHPIELRLCCQPIRSDISLVWCVSCAWETGGCGGLDKLWVLGIASSLRQNSFGRPHDRQSNRTSLTLWPTIDVCPDSREGRRRTACQSSHAPQLNNYAASEPLRPGARRRRSPSPAFCPVG